MFICHMLCDRLQLCSLHSFGFQGYSSGVATSFCFFLWKWVRFLNQWATLILVQLQMRIFILMINRKLEPSVMTLAIPNCIFVMVLHLAKCLLFYFVCLWSWEGGGESTTLRDSDRRCILWSCVLVVTVDNWSMPLIPAPCLSTAETIISLNVCRESTKCSQTTFRGFEVDVMIALKRNFPGLQMNSPALIWLLNLCWCRFTKNTNKCERSKRRKKGWIPLM